MNLKKKKNHNTILYERFRNLVHFSILMIYITIMNLTLILYELPEQKHTEFVLMQ